MGCGAYRFGRVGFDAEYIEADVGWEFWKREGEPLPARTLQVLRTADAALFGAITSRPDPEAQEELEPALRGKGFAYRSPIVRMRQELRLNTKLVHCAFVCRESAQPSRRNRPLGGARKTRRPLQWNRAPSRAAGIARSAAAHEPGDEALRRH
jgi:hypothetical protein